MPKSPEAIDALLQSIMDAGSVDAARKVLDESGYEFSMSSDYEDADSADAADEAPEGAPDAAPEGPMPADMSAMAKGPKLTIVSLRDKMGDDYDKAMQKGK
jgi:hypothetical protein